MNLSEKVYALLLRAYPRHYRARFASPMQQLFRDRLRQVHSSFDLAALWIRTLADWVTSVIACHGEALTRHTLLGTDATQRCLLFARSEAGSFARTEITTEHLLLGVLRAQPSLLPAPALDAIVRTIEAQEANPSRILPQPGNLPLTRQAIRAVSSAREIARRDGREQITPPDLLAGILREPDTLAARVLREHTPIRL